MEEKDLEQLTPRNWGEDFVVIGSTLMHLIIRGKVAKAYYIGSCY